MDEIFKGVRPMDIVLAIGLSALGAVLMVMNIQADPTDTSGLQHAITDQSWLILPVFLLATVPVLWRRRNVVAVALASAVVMGAHVLAFDWVVRCGAALPLSLVLAYSVGKLADRRVQRSAGFRQLPRDGADCRPSHRDLGGDSNPRRHRGRVHPASPPSRPIGTVRCGLGSRSLGTCGRARRRASRRAH